MNFIKNVKPSPKFKNLSFVFQILLKFMAIGLGVLVFRFQNVQFSEPELADFVRINSYTITILGAITLGIPQIIHRFYTQNYHDFELKKHEFTDFWSAFLIFRILSYFLGILLILLTFKLSQSSNLLGIIGIFSAQFIILADLGFRSVADSVGKSWQFSFSDFLGKLVLVLGLFATSFLKNFGNFDLISTFNLFVICSIVAYFIGFCIDWFWQKKFTPFVFLNFQSLGQIWSRNRGEIIFLGVSGLLTSLFLRTDILILNYFGVNSTDLIGYSNSYRLFEIASVVPSLIVPVLATRFWQTCQFQTRQKSTQTNQIHTNINSKNAENYQQNPENYQQNSDLETNLENKTESDLQNNLQSNSQDKTEQNPNFSDQKIKENSQNNSNKNEKNQQFENSKLGENPTKNQKINQQIIITNLKKFLAQISLLGLFCTLLLALLAPIGLQIIDPLSRYTNSSLLVILPLSLMLIFNSISIFIGNLNVFLGGFRSELSVSLGNLTVAIFFYFWLIPLLGILGAAWSSLAIYTIDVILRIFFTFQTWQKYNQNSHKIL